MYSKMTEQLPITITVHSALSETFNKIVGTCNKLEAQFNFHALRANWYGDEDNIVFIQLALENADSYVGHKASLSLMAAKNNANGSGNDVEIKHFSDDVMYCYHAANLQLLCHIAITDSEYELLQSQAKLLPGLLEKKFHKVLNLIAEQLALPGI